MSTITESHLCVVERRVAVLPIAWRNVRPLYSPVDGLLCTLYTGVWIILAHNRRLGRGKSWSIWFSSRDDTPEANKVTLVTPFFLAVGPAPHAVASALWARWQICGDIVAGVAHERRVPTRGNYDKVFWLDVVDVRLVRNSNRCTSLSLDCDLVDRGKVSWAGMFGRFNLAPKRCVHLVADNLGWS